MPWQGWPFERVALVFVGLAFGMISVQVYLMHLGGALHRWQMYVPVLYGPVLMITGLVLAAVMSPTLAILGLVLFGIGLVGGAAGTYYHWNAIGRHIMGFTLRNFVAGPPPVLPAVFAAMSAFGMLVIGWAMYVR